MKKVILFFAGLMFIITLSALDETKTIGDTSFLALRSACLGGDDIIEHYYLQCLSQAIILREDCEKRRKIK